ncbi:MAG: DUF1554 domain-containing protein [Leptospirales bacterium]|nr:DUF1554 domain-containing protein [Leptospirales bacterium]
MIHYCGRMILIAFASIAAVGCVQKFPISDPGTQQSALLVLLANASTTQTGRCNGQTFCYIYATSGAWLGDLGGMPGISGADARCMSDSNKPSSGTYKAVISDGSARIASTTANVGDGQVGWVLYASTEYRRPDGMTVMTTNANKIFVFGALTNFVIATGTYHTGMNTDWTTGAAHCNAWTDNTVGNQDRYGTSNSTSSTALSLTQTACNSATRGLYCAQQ